MDVTRGSVVFVWKSPFWRARAPLCLVPPFDLQSRRFGSEGSNKHELLHTLLIIVRFCPRSAPAPSPVLWSAPRSRVNDRHNTAAVNKEREEKVQFAKPRGRTSVPLRDSRRILRSKEGGNWQLYSAMMMKELFSLLLLLSLIPIGTGLTSCATSRPRHADSSTNHRGHRTTLSSSSLTSSRRRRQQRRE